MEGWVHDSMGQWVARSMDRVKRALGLESKDLGFCSNPLLSPHVTPVDLLMLSDPLFLHLQNTQTISSHQVSSNYYVPSAMPNALQHNVL